MQYVGFPAMQLECSSRQLLALLHILVGFTKAISGSSKKLVIRLVLCLTAQRVSVTPVFGDCKVLIRIFEALSLAWGSYRISPLS
jgi:hypothetical protein